MAKRSRAVDIAPARILPAHPIRHSVRGWYGANPWHLPVVLSGFALAGYVVPLLGPERLLNTTTWWQSILVWFIGALVLHDLLLFPRYALADRLLSRLRRVPRHRHDFARRSVSTVNHLRIPVLAAALLFVMFFPGIVEQGAADYHAATGQTQDPFLTRWLLLTAALFTVSALVYAVRLATNGRNHPGSTAQTDTSTPRTSNGPETLSEE